MSARSILLTRFNLGGLELPNRMVMAPLTRCRAGNGGVPSAINAKYYSQRATAGLIISEATSVSPRGNCFPNIPGLYTRDQEAGWRLVTEAVHAAGGRIFAQLWHGGRVSHSDFQPDGGPPLGASAVAARVQVLTNEGPKSSQTPRALGLSEIAEVVSEYRAAGLVARAAGFDGVEIHAANGYLPDQFLRDGSNHRTDAYGGSPAGRARFVLELAESLVGDWGAERVGVRISPSGTYNDMSDSDPFATYDYVVREFERLRLAYIHVMRASESDRRHGGAIVPLARFRPLFSRAIIANQDFDKESGEAAIAAGEADLIAFGRPFLANPDLPKRFELDALLNTPDPSTFYGGAEKGYIDYPTLDEVRTA